MIPVLYNYSETAFTSRGIGALSDCVSCVVSEELNGGYTVELKYPKNGVHQENLLVRNIIVCSPNKYKDREAFRIYKVDRRLKDYITVYANQLSYDLSGYIAYPCSGYVTSWSLNLRESAPSGTTIKVIYENDAFVVLSSQTISGVVWIQIKLYSDGTVGWCDSTYTYLYDGATSLADAIQHLNTCAGDFTLSTNKSSSTAFKMDVPASVRSWFGGKEGSLIDVYGGEWEYDFFNCNLLTARGSDTGLRISYGVNLAEYIRQNEDNMYSHVMAYYASNDEAGNLTEAHGDEVATGATSIHRTLLLNVTSEYQNGTVPTAAQLTTYATNYVTAHRSELIGDAQTITVTPEILNTQEIDMGDTVHVIYDDEMITTRVIKTVWNALADKYDSVVLGTKKTSIAETIKSLSTSGPETANNVIVDNALNGSSTHPVQNKVINTALNNKVDKEAGKGLSTNDYTTAEKNKLASLPSGDSSTTFTATLSSISGAQAVFKRGDWGVIQLALGNNTAFSNATGYDTVGTIPTGYRPKYNLVIPITGRNNSTWASATFYNISMRIETGGSVIIIGKAADIKACRYLNGTIVYPLA